MAEEVVQPIETADPEVTQPLAAQVETATADLTTTPEVATPPTPAEWQGVRDFARGQGVDLPFDDDAAALNTLIAAYRQSQQRNYYAELGQRIAPHADRIQQFLQTQQQPAAPQAPPAWQPPTFKREWLQQVERDQETGLLKAKPGFDPALPEKVQAYADWRDKFLDSPEQVLGPLVEERARAIVREEQGVYQTQALANDLIARDAGWMFAADARGQRQLTPAGSMYATAARQLWDGGLRDVRQVHLQARAAVENAVLRQQVASLQPPAANTASLAAAAVPTNVGGTVTRPAVSPPAGPTGGKGLSLREKLMVNLDRVEAPESLSL